VINCFLYGSSSRAWLTLCGNAAQTRFRGPAQPPSSHHTTSWRVSQPSARTNRTY